MKLLQDGGDNSTNYQAQGNITVNTGISAVEVMDIAERVVKSNMKDLADLARDTAEERIHRFAQQLSGRLEEDPTVQRSALTDPDVQYAISNAGIAYARRGTEELSEILLDLVSGRISSPGDSLMATVLNDAIEIAPRLIQAERAVLVIAWVFLRSIQPSAMSLEDLRFYHQPVLRAFGPDLPKRDGSYLHLQSMGCISTNTLGGGSFASLWHQPYAGFFQSGLSIDQITQELVPFWDDTRVFEPSPHREGMRQVAGGGASDDYLASLGLTDGLVQALKVLRSRHLPEAEIVEMVKATNPDVSYLEACWEQLGSAAPSAVGIAIAHAVFSQKFGEGPDLAIWLGEG